MQKQRKSEPPHTLIGTWINGDEYQTEVEYIVSAEKNGFVVRAVDRYDGEKGEVSDVKREGNVLSFAVYWNSTGRLVNARLKAISPNRVEYTYTFTDQEMWQRKKIEPIDSPARRALKSVSSIQGSRQRKRKT